MICAMVMVGRPPALARARSGLLLWAALATVAEGAASAAPASEPSELSEALHSGDECSSAAAGEARPSCALQALQLHRARLGQSAGASGGGSGGDGGEAGGDTAVAFESAPAIQGSWSNEGRCAGELPHELLFVMRQPDGNEIERMVVDRTSPGSPNFRKWLSPEEVSALTRNVAGLEALRAFLTRSEGLLSIQETPGGGVVRAEAPVAFWEGILGTEFHVHRHRDTGRTLVRAPSYALPRDLRAHVAGVLKAVELGELVPGARRGGGGAAAAGGGPSAARRGASVEALCSPDSPGLVCDTFKELQAVDPVVVSPPVLRRVYGMPPVAVNNSAEAEERANTSQMVYASLNQHWSPNDRAEFVEAFDINPPHAVTQLDLGDAMSSNVICMTSPNDCAESNLDVQYMTAMSPWSHLGYFYMPEETTFYDFLYSFITDLVEMPRVPHVVSISYGMPEAGSTKTARHAFDMMAKTLALQGVTLLAASGDDGAAGSMDRSEKFGPCWLTERFGLQVNWPASSPWVTAVGATMGAASGHREVVCSVNATGPAAEAAALRPPLITSGGGFSGEAPRPAWQEGHHGEERRGVPDLSLAGHAYAVVLGGKWLTVDGTSASSPTLGGMISLINARRLAEGKERVGFLNPLLYAHPEAFTDVTEGDNRCGSHGTPCCGGYDAAEGWDPATGLGTPDFAKLEVALS